MLNFTDKLIKNITKKKSCVIVGLDPRLELIPKSIIGKKPLNAANSAKSILKFNKSVIDIIKDHAVGVKPQSAFYEKYGWQGVKAFWHTLAYAKNKGLITIADIKRGDISSTAQAYAEAYLGPCKMQTEKCTQRTGCIDAVTLNPFLGKDSLDPFINLASKNGKGLFILVKTSNKGSKDFQDKKISNGKPLYIFLARNMRKWSNTLTGKKGYSSLGAVVGATFPRESKILRKTMPRQFFLVPGYGAQGAGAKDIKHNFNKDGLGALINSSRGIIHSYKNPSSKDWRLTIHDAVVKMKQDIQSIIG